MGVTQLTKQNEKKKTTIHRKPPIGGENEVITRESSEAAPKIWCRGVPGHSWNLVYWGNEVNP